MANLVLRCTGNEINLTKPHQAICRYDASAAGTGTGTTNEPWESFVVPLAETESLVLTDIALAFSTGMGIVVSVGLVIYGGAVAIKAARLI